MFQPTQRRISEKIKSGSSGSCARHRRRPTTKTNGSMAARSDASRHQQSGLVLSSSQGDTSRLVISAITDPAAAEQTSQPSRFFVQGR
jgi:hypothetical protein